MKERLDVRLVRQGLMRGREQAKEAIQAGQVFVNGARVQKAGTFVDSDTPVTVMADEMPFVSRGGRKLAAAISQFHIPLNGRICMDVGASTGGFTDCMLQNGANRVYAIDVGTGQLVDTLRTNPRVISMEQTNIRYLTPHDMPELVEFVSIDVSFISLTKVLFPVQQLMKPGAEMVCLIKPQFEAGKAGVGKKGVVRDLNVHRDVLKQVLSYVTELRFTVLGLDFSPIVGQEGNIEYLLYVRNAVTIS